MKTNTDKYIGLTLAQAVKIWPNIHVSEEDGVNFAKTMIYNPNRMNVIIKNKVIVKVIGFN